MQTVYLLILLSLISLSLEKKPLTIFELQSKPEYQNLKGLQVQIIESCNHEEDDGINKRQFYSIIIKRRYKRQVFINLNNKIKSILKLLIKHQIIEDQSQMVRGKTLPKFLSKQNVWKIQFLFALEGPSQVMSVLRGQWGKMSINAKQLQYDPYRNYLSQKFKSKRVFKKAKQQLKQQLKRFDTNYIIKEVQKIEIDGNNIENSDILQHQIEQEYSNSQQYLNEKQVFFIKNASRNIQTERIQKMRVIFEISEAQQQEKDEDLNDDTEDTQSNVSDQISQTEQSEDSL